MLSSRPPPPPPHRAMFMSGLSESKQTHVHLRNVDPATLQIIITYAYTGNLAISDSTVEPLYETACFLQVGAEGGGVTKTHENTRKHLKTKTIPGFSFKYLFLFWESL